MTSQRAVFWHRMFDTHFLNRARDRENYSGFFPNFSDTSDILLTSFDNVLDGVEKKSSSSSYYYYSQALYPVWLGGLHDSQANKQAKQHNENSQKKTDFETCCVSLFLNLLCC